MIIYFCSDLNKKKSFGLEKSIIPIKKKLKTTGLKIYIFKKINFKTIKNIFNCKIVHIHGCWSFSNLICFIISKFLKKKLIFSPHGMLDPVPLSIKKLKKKIALFLYQKNILKLSDYILVNSKLEKKNIRRLEKNRKIIVIPHGIDNYNIKKKKNKKKIFFIFF